MERTRKIYTVSDLTGKIKHLLEENFSFVWVCGEISNYSQPASGHSYFTLKDTGAVINCVMFKNQKRQLKFHLQNGINIYGLARLAVYEPRGQYQLIFELIEPEGAGALQIAFEQLKTKLSDLGFFDPDKKKSLPMIPGTVCLITSVSGAVIKDFIQISTRRFPGCSIQILPVSVQGADAEKQICQALSFANQTVNPDVIVLARGGGSLEDLAAFNSESVAIAVNDSKIPVVSAIGHETDYTICDFVSDVRAPTPSAAAEIIYPDIQAVCKTINALRQRLNLSLKNQVYQRRLHIEDCSLRLKTCLLNQSRYKRQGIKALANRLALLSPGNQCRQSRQKIQLARIQLKQKMEMMISRARNSHDMLSSKLSTLNPKAVLDRGYSIAFALPDQQVLKDTKNLQTNQKIHVILSDGQFDAKVEKIHGSQKNV